MGSPRAIADDRARSALGRSVAVLQHLMRWGTEALDGLDHHSDQLADLARALLRNHATGPQVQRLIRMLGSGQLSNSPDEGLTATRHEVLRLMFESVAGKAYSDNAWEDATHSGGLPFDNGLDTIKLARRLRRLGLHHGWDAGNANFPVSELQGVTVSCVKKYNYPARGARPQEFEPSLDGVSGQCASFSLGVAMLMLAPQMIGRSETLIFSGAVISPDSSGGTDYQWFPGLARNCDNQLRMVKCRLDVSRTPSDNFWYSVRIVRP